MIKKTAVLLCTLIFALPACAMDQQKEEEALKTEWLEKHSAYIKENLAGDRTITSIERLKNERHPPKYPRLYDVSYDNGESVVVRFFPDGNCSTEIQAAYDAGEAGIGPEILWCNVGGKRATNEFEHIIMEKINTMPAQDVPWDQEDTYVKLGTVLKKMHDQQSEVCVDENKSLYCRTKRCIDYITKNCAEEYKPVVTDLFVKLQTCMDVAQKVLTPVERKVLVHGNLHTGNLLFEKDENGSLGRILVVDWEHTGYQADPMIDLIMVANMFVPKEFRIAFGDAYLKDKNVDEVLNARLHVMHTLVSCFFGLAYATSDPSSFAQQFQAMTQSKNQHAGKQVRSIIQSGFKRDTDEDATKFGTLLFYQGFKHIARDQYQRRIKTLQDSAQDS